MQADTNSEALKWYTAIELNHRSAIGTCEYNNMSYYIIFFIN